MQGYGQKAGKLIVSVCSIEPALAGQADSSPFMMFDDFITLTLLCGWPRMAESQPWTFILGLQWLQEKKLKKAKVSADDWGLSVP